jgi:hypothetical protein
LCFGPAFASAAAREMDASNAPARHAENLCSSWKFIEISLELVTVRRRAWFRVSAMTQQLHG